MQDDSLEHQRPLHPDAPLPGNGSGRGTSRGTSLGTNSAEFDGLRPARRDSLLAWRICFLLAFLCGVFLCARAALYQNATYDEPNHYAWSARLIDGVDISRDLADWMISQTPVTLLNVVTGRIGENLADESPFFDSLRRQNGWFFRRFATILLFAILTLATVKLGTLAGGPRVGYLAGSAVALDPNLIAHGSLVTVDVAFAAATVLTLITALQFGQRPTLGRAMLLGLTFGLAFVTKFTAILLLACFALLPLARARPPRIALRPLAALTGCCAAVALTALCVTQAAYLYRHIGIPFNEMPFKTPLFRSLGQTLGSLRSPLPLELLTGIDHCMFAEKSQAWNAVVLNKFSADGFWYYFPVHFLMKTPILMTLVTLLGLTQSLLSGTLLANSRLRWIALSLCLFGGYFCLLFRVQVGYRYVLFCLPLIYIIAAAAWAPFIQSQRSFFWPVLALGGSLLEIAPYSQTPISFSNLFIQPKKEVYRYLADSNLDWAQNANQIQSGLRELGLSEVPWNPPHIVPGWNVLTGNWLAGVLWNRPQYRWVRNNLTPDAAVSDTIFLYYVSRSVFDAYLRAERTIQPLQRQHPACAGGAHGDGTSGDATTDSESKLCFQTAGSLLHVTALSGTIGFGPVSEDGQCNIQYLQTKQELWYRLEPGFHAFCGSGTHQTVHFRVEPLAPAPPPTAESAGSPPPAAE